jgi:hypothetical protein
MSTRLRGLLIFLGATVLTIVMGLWLVEKATAGQVSTRSGSKMVFALPVIGMLWGLLELVTGRRFQELDAWYQKFPMWKSYPLGCLGGIAMLVVCYVWIVLLLRLVGR